MSENDQHAANRRSAKPWFFALALVALIGLVMVRVLREAPQPPPGPTAADPSRIRLPVHQPPVIDFEALEQDETAKQLMDQRKADYGLKNAMDAIVTDRETIRLGDETVAMADIQRQIAIKEGRIVESETGARGASATPSEVYGIHVVRPGDNLWNIHFALLKEYFKAKGVQLPPLADEPKINGTSSGIGRLLKFSEGMVYIYNLRERRLDPSIDLIYPRSKIIVYRMKAVFSLLDQIDVNALDRIRFDGDTLWLLASP
ncbi:MAG: hypothetical protein RBR20_01060 [Desulfobacterales bacterium]|jgi:hypothetical protein|nr:hypothetical protein [Desulfobacteraceae bacterium]MDD3991097.1 hypothetical protein [Desulfobacteraceae bacterium]MDY0310688.1 hypothetical protein [Desulfobacterales bacterium]